jgi:predicted phosphodiesterase
MFINSKGHKIFAFADTHGLYRRLSVPADADILVCAGDACEGFAPDELKDFFAWYNSIPAIIRIFVAGNHDMVFDQQPEYARSLVPEGVKFLENDGIEFKGIMIYSVAARPYLGGAVVLPDGIDFLITHGPAYGHLDRGEGDRDLYLAIAKARPKYHIFGHVHEEGLKREAILGGTTYLNVAYFNSLRYCSPSEGSS